jgi:hypothetical protein
MTRNVPSVPIAMSHSGVTYGYSPTPSVKIAIRQAIRGVRRALLSTSRYCAAAAFLDGQITEIDEQIRSLYTPRSLPYAAIPILKALAERLKAQGKLGKQIVDAIMRRLLVLAYGVPGSRLG